MKKTGILIAALAAVILIAFVAYDGIFNKSVSVDFFAMNTVGNIKITGKDADETAELIEAKINSLDTDLLSRHDKNSALSKVNSGEDVESEELAAYIKALIEVSEKSGGAFDFTLGAVSDLWGFGGEASVPDSAVLAEALSHSGYEKISVTDNRIILEDRNAVIDLGAAGKGIALDKAKEILSAQNAKKAVISVGGSVLLYGEGDFTVGIRNPEGNAGEYIAVLRTNACCVSTSGNYERYFEENGKRYHHILDPGSGYPAESGVVSVTVISENGLLSDALSTACFVLGVEKGSELAKEFGCEAVFVAADKKIYATDGAKAMITVEAEGYALAE